MYGWVTMFYKSLIEWIIRYIIYGGGAWDNPLYEEMYMKGTAMRKFDTKVQHLKYKVYREVARQAYAGRLLETIYDIPKQIMPGPKPTMRCCVFKERAIIAERIKMAMGGDHKNPNVIEVLDIACDECPVGGHVITDMCRGCIAHYCKDACPRDAIESDEQLRSHIVKDKCIECGKCLKACPYNAVVNIKRPCETACKVQAIDMNEDRSARIDASKCIACGACVFQCPFGAIMDKSYLLQVVRFIRERESGGVKNLYAVVAPSIASQFAYAKLGQVIAGIKRLGFDDVYEAALGADMTAGLEAQELVEKGFLTSSCCPAFVDFVEKQFPELAGHISQNPSPMVQIARHIKERSPEAKVVFIGPCTAKKMEAQKEAVRPYIDAVLTFEELQALCDSREIDIAALQEDVLDTASFYGRIFARSGGVSEAVGQAIHEYGRAGFAYNPIACDGIEACRTALLRYSKNALPHNFIEGMACVGGCIGGAGCLTHGIKDARGVDTYGKQASAMSIHDAVDSVIGE